MGHGNDSTVAEEFDKITLDESRAEVLSIHMLCYVLDGSIGFSEDAQVPGWPAIAWAWPPWSVRRQLREDSQPFFLFRRRLPAPSSSGFSNSKLSDGCFRGRESWLLAVAAEVARLSDVSEGVRCAAGAGCRAASQLLGAARLNSKMDDVLKQTLCEQDIVAPLSSRQSRLFHIWISIQMFRL